MLGIHIAGPSKPGQFAESWVDLLFVKGFDAGQPIIYLSTDAGQPLTAVLERSVYVPALNDVSFNGGDDFLGSARERLFGFVNGQSGAGNPNGQGFVNLIKTGHGSAPGYESHTTGLDPRTRDHHRDHRCPCRARSERGSAGSVAPAAAPCPSRMELTFHFARASVEAGNVRGDRLAA